MSKSISQRAVDYAGDRSQGAGHGFPSWEARLIEKGYKKGAKDQKKLMYDEEEVMEMFHKLSMHLPLHYEFLVREMFKNK